MINFTRTDTSIIGKWWWTIDRWTILAVVLLIALGAMFTMAASPPVAARIGADGFHFVRKQFIFLPPTLLLILGISLLSPVNLRRIAAIGFLFSVFMVVMTIFVGTEIKGAVRSFRILGMSIQASEFLKPTFAVVAAWMFAEQRLRPEFPGNYIAAFLYIIVAALLLHQPDIGMTIVVTAVWFTQFFLAGLPLFWVVLFGIGGIFAVIAAYYTFPHVASRIDRFIDPASGDNFQVATALQAFGNGGVFGRGPGEGQVKAKLPDAHSDFILAVAGEEFGLIVCLLVVGLFAFIMLRGFSRVMQENNLFILLATAGLLVQFSFQAIINMASTLRLMPTKGMTLPFISYGGSSMLALGLGIGMVLGFTRKRSGGEI